MLDPSLGHFDYAVSMDSLIHYQLADVTATVERFAARATSGVLFTSAPWTPALGAMHFVGRLLPKRADRAPSIVPIRASELEAELGRTLPSTAWQIGRREKISSGFYISSALEIVKTCNN